MLPETLPEVAVIFAVPGEKAVARPLLLTAATDVSDERHVTCMVMT